MEGVATRRAALRQRAAEYRRVAPDVLRLLRALAKDPAVPRWRLLVLLGYLAMPFDLIPDFIPVLGYADDVLVVAWTLRSVIGRVGPEVVERNWPGTPEGLALVRRLTRTGVRRHPPPRPGP